MGGQVLHLTGQCLVAGRQRLIALTELYPAGGTDKDREVLCLECPPARPGHHWPVVLRPHTGIAVDVKQGPVALLLQRLPVIDRDAVPSILVRQIVLLLQLDQAGPFHRELDGEPKPLVHVQKST